MKKIELEIPVYERDSGFAFQWSEGFEIRTDVEGNQILITANKAGLESMANHFLNLAQSNIPEGYHLHFDDINSLEDGSIELVVKKV